MLAKLNHRQIPGLSTTKPIFQDFLGPGNFRKKNPQFFRRRGNPVQAIPRINSNKRGIKNATFGTQ